MQGTLAPIADLNIPAVALSKGVHDDKHVLLWQVLGTTDLTTGGDVNELPEGHCIWLPAGTRHQIVVRADSIALPMTFDASTTATTMEPVSALPSDGRFPILALALIQSECMSLTPPANLRRQILGLLENTPGRMCGLTMPVAPAARLVAEALLFDPGDDRLVHDWAIITNTSTRSIERAFLRETGMTLQQWRLKCRMDTAGLLLAHASPVAAVAHRVGYENHSSFGRVFKAHFGLSPTEFRNRAV